MPWRCRRPDTGSWLGLEIARGVRPRVPTGCFDAVGFARPLRIEQVLVVGTVVNGLEDGVHGEPIFASNIFRREGLQTDRFAVENLRPDTAIHEELPIV